MLRKTDSTKLVDWTEIAEADLVLVWLVAASEVSFGSCRVKLAEALEKVLKAELIRLGWALEKTHDLQRLAKFLRERGSDLVDPAAPLVNALTEAYFSDRYPGFDLDDPGALRDVSSERSARTLTARDSPHARREHGGSVFGEASCGQADEGGTEMAQQARPVAADVRRLSFRFCDKEISRTGCSR